jgi:hypothetical protein
VSVFVIIVRDVFSLICQQSLKKTHDDEIFVEVSCTPRNSTKTSFLSQKNIGIQHKSLKESWF